MVPRRNERRGDTGRRALRHRPRADAKHGKGAPHRRPFFMRVLFRWHRSGAGPVGRADSLQSHLEDPHRRAAVGKQIADLVQLLAADRRDVADAADRQRNFPAIAVGGRHEGEIADAALRVRVQGVGACRRIEGDDAECVEADRAVVGVAAAFDHLDRAAEKRPDSLGLHEGDAAAVGFAHRCRAAPDAVERRQGAHRLGLAGDEGGGVVRLGRRGDRRQRGSAGEDESQEAHGRLRCRRTGHGRELCRAPRPLPPPAPRPARYHPRLLRASAPPCMHDKSNRRLLDVDIPAQPDVLVKLSLLLAEDEVDLNAASLLISSDMALAAAVLKAVNSAMYGLRGRVQSVQQAITYLGTREVASVTFEMGLRAVFPDAPELQSLWERSRVRGLLMGRIANALGVDAWAAHSAGLFEECGKAVMFRHATERYKPLLAEAKDDEELLMLEHAKFGVSHDSLGAALCESWGV